MAFEDTTTLTSATSPPLPLTHGQQVFVTVVCSNSEGLSHRVTSEELTVISQPPSAAGAYVTLQPQATTDFQPWHNTQASKQAVEFTFEGFEDASGIMVGYTPNFTKLMY